MQKYSINHIKLLLAKLYPSFYDAIKNDFTEQAFEDVKIVPVDGMEFKTSAGDTVFALEKKENGNFKVFYKKDNVKHFVRIIYSFKEVSEYLTDGTWQIVSIPEKHKGALKLHDEITIIEHREDVNKNKVIHFKYKDKDYIYTKHIKLIFNGVPQSSIQDEKGLYIYSTSCPEKNTATGNYLETLLFQITKP